MNAHPSPMAVLSDVLFGRAWNRVLPNSVIAILPPLLMDGPMTRDELDRTLREDPHSADGLNSSAWEPLHLWTDEELKDLDEQFADTPLAVDEERTADQVIAEDAARREKALQQMERYFESFGLPIDHSIGGLVDLLVACRVLTLSDGHLSVNEASPLPGEVLPLDPDEAATQDELRWRRLHERTAQAVIALFDVDGQAIDVLHTSIAGLARTLELDPESIRTAVQQLIEEGDFKTTINVETAEEDVPFDLRVDWEQFSRTRVGIHFMHEPDEDLT